MNRLPPAKRAQILGLMAGGYVNQDYFADHTGASKNTIVKLLANAGRTCSEYRDRALRDLPCNRLRLDEILSFAGMKNRNVPAERKGTGVGDI